MKDWFKKLMSGVDNCTPDIGRWSWLIGIIAVVAAAGGNLVASGSVNLRELAESLGIVSAASGVAVAVKGKTEPNEKPTKGEPQDA